MKINTSKRSFIKCLTVSATATKVAPALAFNDKEIKEKTLKKTNCSISNATDLRKYYKGDSLEKI